MVYNVPAWRFFMASVHVLSTWLRAFACGGFIAASRPLFLSLSAYLGIFVFGCRSV